MNARAEPSALRARAAPSIMPAFIPPAPSGLTQGHIDNYRRCLAGFLHLNSLALKIQHAERDLNRVDLVPSTEHIRAHVAMGIEKIYRLLSDDALPCDVSAKRDRVALRRECGAALGF